MKLSFTTIDSFTSTRYTGNPVAIIRVPSNLKIELTQTKKQDIAKEFNLSEIVFLHLPPPNSPASAEREIDIFTSFAEVPFAGHPTIGVSHYLLNFSPSSNPENGNVTSVITKAGRIPISLFKEKAGGKRVEVEVPYDYHCHKITYPTPSSLLKEDGSESGMENPLVSIVNGMSFIFVSLPSLKALGLAVKTKSLAPDTYDPSPLDEGWQNGLIGTMYHVSQGVDEEGRERFRTRMFASREDPGTGSASSGLACWLALNTKAGVEGKGEGGNKRERKFIFEQGVEMGRRNEIFVGVTVKEDGKGVEKVVLSGEGCEVMEGVLEV